jgi:tetratricopeptide (TPR) repeat protein
MRFLWLVLSLWLLSGCAGLTGGPEPFPERDLYTMLMVDALSREDYNAAADYQRILYENTHEDRFFYDQIDSLLRAGRYDEVIALTKKRLKEDEEKIARRYLAYAHAGKEQYEEAIAVARELITYDREAEDYLLLGDLVIQGRNRPKAALEYYKSAYALDPAERTVDAIATLLIETQGAHQEAFAYYESHILQYGCSEFLCQKVANFYAGRGNIAGVIRAYQRIYAAREDPIVGQKLIELYMLREDYDALAAWLEKSRFNDKALLELYRQRGNLKSASVVAGRLYDETRNSDYLALSGMLLYESEGDASRIDRALDKLRGALEKGAREPTYLNYLGYLLIDHQRGIEEGIALVKEALLTDPDNPAYLDSLAWGYYHLGRYEEADALIQEALKGLPEDPTVREHHEKIQSALRREQ